MTTRNTFDKIHTMNHSSTITSKGTITLPAGIRSTLGLREGDKVDIALHGSVITITPKLGWDEFFSDELDMGAKARKMIAKGDKKALLTNADIAAVTRTVRGSRHA